MSRTKAVGVLMAVLVIASLGVVSMGYHETPEGHVGVYKNWGATSGHVADPGAHIIMPVKQGVQDVEVRPRKYTMTRKSSEGKKTGNDAITVQSINGTTFPVDVTVTYRVKADNATEFVQEWNTENQVEQRMIRPIVRSEIRNAAGGIQSSEIYTRTGREKMREAAATSLRNRSADEPIVIESVDIRGVGIPNDYQNALTQKEIAKQRVEREQQRVRQERLQAEQQIIKAEADAQERLIRANATAESNRKVAQSLTDDLIRYEHIQKLDGTDTIYMPIGEDGLPVLLERNESGN